jgi:hypothetical protein
MTPPSLARFSAPNNKTTKKMEKKTKKKKASTASGYIRRA